MSVEDKIRTSQRSVGGMRRHMMALVVSSALALTFQIGDGVAAPVIGTSAAVKGTVFVTTKGAQRKAQVKNSIKLQDRVLTRDDSALQILLLDKSIFTVGQNCEMVIDRFVYDPASDAGNMAAKVTKGAFRFASGNIGKANPTNASIQTPSATIGVRGTIFDGIVGEDAAFLAQLAGVQGNPTNSASIVILLGPSKDKNTLDEQGVVDITSGGQTVTLTEPNTIAFSLGDGSPPIGPLVITPAIRSYLDHFLGSTPSGDTENPGGLDNDGSSESGQDQFEAGLDDPDNVLEDEEELINDIIEETLVEEEEEVTCSYPYSAGAHVISGCP